MKTISSILKSFSANSLNKFNLVLSRAEKDLSKAFIDICIDTFDLIESNIKEDESLKEYRAEWNDTFKELGITNSSFTFANMIKIGNIAKKDKAWLLGFKNLTCLAIGLASMQSVPACNGVGSLEIVTTNKAEKPIAETIKDIPNNLETKELRERVNTLKGMPTLSDRNEKAFKEKEQKALENKALESSPVHNSKEQSAYNLAMELKRQCDISNDYLIAFCAHIFNVDQDFSIKLCDQLTMVNKSKRYDLSGK